MKRLLLPLLAALALPAAVNAESVWLVLVAEDSNDHSSMEKILMKDMNQCEIQGVRWLSSDRSSVHPSNKGFECFVGK